MTRFALLLAMLGATACAHQPEHRARVRVSSAQLVTVNPDVKTVADADQPLFFARGYFWLFHDGGWWRGERASDEVWVKVNNPPVPVKQITNPYAFTNYRKSTATQTAVNETKATGLLQQSLLAPPRPEMQAPKDETAEDTSAQKADPDQPKAQVEPQKPVQTQTEKSTDPSDPSSTIDGPSF